MGRLANYALRLDEGFRDHRLGICTSEWHQLIDPEHPERRGYGPTFYRDWNTIRRHITVDPHATFIDYGAGLGRVTILAAKLPFACVLGVEFDADLVARAKANIERAVSSLVAPARVICTDATAFDIPLNASTFFFCNPFTGSILAAVLAKIWQSHADRPRPMQIICNLPELCAFEGEISAVEWLKLDRMIGLSHRRKCLIFTPLD